MVDGIFLSKTDHSGWDFAVYNMSNTILHVAARSNKRRSIQAVKFE